MRKILLSLLLLLMVTAVQAQRIPCANRLKLPYPENKTRAATRTGSTGIPKKITGEKRGLIILMEFQDVKFNNKNKNGKTFDVHDLWNDIANKENLKNVNGVLVNGSIGDYFRQQSYGQFNLVFDVCGPYTAKNKYAYYGRNKDLGGGYIFDQHPDELIIEAVNTAKNEVDYKDYDWDDDGEVDQVYVVYAGHGEASYDDPDCIWPHEGGLIDSWGQDVNLQGLKFNTYACGNELDPADKTMGIGTICHEFSHCLGFPDVYNTESGGMSNVGYYDLMDGGNYNGDSWYPAGYSAYERYLCGWIEPKPINSVAEAGDLLPLHESPDAYIISEFEGATNYYLIEKRAKASWDKFLPCFTNNATGEAVNEKMLYWHIDFNQENWIHNKVNVDPEHPGISLVEADQGPTAIKASEKTATKPAAWYDLQGHQLQGAPSQHGIYIVRYDDGTTKKHIR